MCGLSDEEIILNYHKSDCFLEPVNHLIAEENGKKGLVGFDDTPKHVMQDTLAYLNSDECGGIENYLESIGFSQYEQVQLIRCIVSNLLSFSLSLS